MVAVKICADLPSSVCLPNLKSIQTRFRAHLDSGHRLVHDHSRDAVPIFLFLRCVNAMGVWIHGKTVDFLLHREVFQLAVMIWIVHLKYRDRFHWGSEKNSFKTWVQFYYIRSGGPRQKDNG